MTSTALGASECTGTLVVHETGHRSCTRQAACVGPATRHRIVARCGGCEACGRARALSFDDSRPLPARTAPWAEVVLNEPGGAGSFVTRSVCGSGLHANVRVHGDLDAEGAPVLASELEALVSSGVREITIDLEPMAFMDRGAHDVMADAAARLHDLGGRLLLAHSAS